MKNNLSLIVLLIIIITTIVILFSSPCKTKKWKCIDGGCAFDIGGTFESQESCEKSCSKEKYDDTPIQTSYNCNRNSGTCTSIPNNSGTYANFQSCTDNCVKSPEIIYEKPYYHPWWHGRYGGRRFHNWFRGGWY